MASKTCQAQAGQSDFSSSWKSLFLLVFGFTFWPLFDQVLDHLWISLGVVWEPSRASWGFLGKPLDPKTLKNWGFFKLFENAAFWLFEAPDGSLGLILPPLWPIWSQSGPQNGSQKWSKKWSKSWSKMTPKVIKNDTKKLVQRGFHF